MKDINLARRGILERFKKEPISTMDSKGKTYSIDQAIKELAELDLPEAKERLDFTLVKSMMSDFICTIIVMSNAKISDEALNDLSNTYADRFLDKFSPAPSKDVMDVEKIKDIIAQPPDRISHITIKSYEKIRQAILKELDSFTPPEGKGISEEKVKEITRDAGAGGGLPLSMAENIAKEICKAHREGRL